MTTDFLRNGDVLYLSVLGDDDFSEMVVHGGHGLADRVQSHVHLPLHSVAVREQTHQLHHNLHGRNNTSVEQHISGQKVSGMFSKAVRRRKYATSVTNSGTSAFHLMRFGEVDAAMTLKVGSRMPSVQRQYHGVQGIKRYFSTRHTNYATNMPSWEREEKALKL